MIFLVEYTQNDVACSMRVEAADEQTAKVAVNQWRVRKLRYRNDTIKIDAITAYRVEAAEQPDLDTFRHQRNHDMGDTVRQYLSR